MSRPIQATLFRGKHKKPIWTRYYARITTGFPRAVELAILSGQPGDVIEFSSTNHGYQIGTVKLRVMGHMEVRWTILEES